MWATRTSSGAAPIGPRRRHVQETVSPAAAHTHWVPHAADPLHAIRPTGGDRLGDQSTSAGPKGRRPPAGPPSRTVTRSPSAARRSWPAADDGLRPEHPVRGSLGPPSPPVRRPRRRDPHQRHGLEVLPAQQTHHYLTLAPGREPTPTAAPGATPVATDSSTCFLISTLLLRQVSRKLMRINADDHRPRIRRRGYAVGHRYTSSGCGPSWPGWADRTVTGRGCSRPLLGHGPSGQLAAVRVAGGR